MEMSRWENWITGSAVRFLKTWHLTPHSFSTHCTLLLYFASQRNWGNEIWNTCWLQKYQYEFNVFHIRALYYTKPLITNKCTKRVLSSIVTHSYMFQPCWVILRENFFVIVTLRLHFIVEWECAVNCVLCTGGVNSLWSWLASQDHREFMPPKTTQYTVNSTFSLNYKVQP
jgi:hypothetical protein